MADHDPVNHPQHYTSHPSGVECITITEHFGFNLGNVIKYIWRAEDKHFPIQDLKKAAWYLQREITKREEESLREQPERAYHAAAVEPAEIYEPKDVEPIQPADRLIQRCDECLWHNQHAPTCSRRAGRSPRR